MRILCRCEVGVCETRHNCHLVFPDIHVHRNDDSIVILIGLDHIVIGINHNGQVITPRLRYRQRETRAELHSLPWAVRAADTHIT
ncbi:hypothetical protein SDC9_181186 [bioreactor metagenome]|uniref:Uncharacterized protein n=1 Tax=bioreactor metagenome TaxID=1076179 RepID=A0A645H3T5_9ZZZZ